MGGGERERGQQVLGRDQKGKKSVGYCPGR